MPEVRVVVKKSSCDVEGMLEVSPFFFNRDECYGCSFYHVCSRLYWLDKKA